MSATKQKRSCAYCGGSDLTREHLIPKGYFDRTGRASEFVANVKVGTSEKFISVEPAIADVCGGCNNGVLSHLDSYFLTLFDRSLSTVVVSGKEISFECDFDKLLRWLLKMGYNMGRARQWVGIQYLQACRDYIRFGTPHPDNITLLMQASTPGSFPGLPRIEFLPDMFVVNALRIPRIQKDFPFVLHLGIHCYQFYVLFHDTATKTFDRNKRVKAFQRMFRGTYKLSPGKDIVKIYPASDTLWDLVNGPFWDAGWAQQLRNYFGYARRDKRAKDRLRL